MHTQLKKVIFIIYQIQMIIFFTLEIPVLFGNGIGQHHNFLTAEIDNQNRNVFNDKHAHVHTQPYLKYHCVNVV